MDLNRIHRWNPLILALNQNHPHIRRHTHTNNHHQEIFLKMGV